MKTIYAMLLSLGLSAAAYADPSCTATSTIRGNVDLATKPYSFKGKTGIQFNVQDQTKNPYSLMITILQSSPNDVSVILTDLMTNQSSGFDGGFSNSDKLSGTIVIRGKNGDDIVQVTCQK